MNALRSLIPITFHKKLRRSVLVSVLLIAGLAGANQVAASPSFSTAISFFQGFSIATESFEGDPAMIRLVFGSAGQAELVPMPGWDVTFSPSVDFSFGYEIGVEHPVVFVPENIAGMVVLEGMAFERIDTGILDDFELTHTPVAVSLDADDTVVIVTADDTVFKIGDIVQQPDLTTLRFTYQQLTTGYEAPEPTTLLLVGVGLGIIGLIGFIKRKKS